MKKRNILKTYFFSFLLIIFTFSSFASDNEEWEQESQRGRSQHRAIFEMLPLSTSIEPEFYKRGLEILSAALGVENEDTKSIYKEAEEKFLTFTKECEQARVAAVPLSARSFNPFNLSLSLWSPHKIIASSQKSIPQYTEYEADAYYMLALLTLQKWNKSNYPEYRSFLDKAIQGGSTQAMWLDAWFCDGENFPYVNQYATGDSSEIFHKYRIALDALRIKKHERFYLWQVDRSKQIEKKGRLIQFTIVTPQKLTLDLLATMFCSRYIQKDNKELQKLRAEWMIDLKRLHLEVLNSPFISHMSNLGWAYLQFGNRDEKILANWLFIKKRIILEIKEKEQYGGEIRVHKKKECNFGECKHFNFFLNYLNSLYLIFQEPVNSVDRPQNQISVNIERFKTDFKSNDIVKSLPFLGKVLKEVYDKAESFLESFLTISRHVRNLFLLDQEYFTLRDFVANFSRIPYMLDHVTVVNMFDHQFSSWGLESVKLTKDLRDLLDSRMYDNEGERDNFLVLNFLFDLLNGKDFKNITFPEYLMTENPNAFVTQRLVHTLQRTFKLAISFKTGSPYDAKSPYEDKRLGFLKEAIFKLDNVLELLEDLINNFKILVVEEARWRAHRLISSPCPANKKAEEGEGIGEHQEKELPPLVIQDRKKD